MSHEFTDPDNTGRCQARPVYLAIPGAIEAKCLMTAEQHQRQLSPAEQKLAAIRQLASTWAVDDDTYLHMESCQDLGYADAAVQILAIIDGTPNDNDTPRTTAM